MKQRKRTLGEALELIVRAHQAKKWYSMPGIVEAYDAAKQKATIRVAVDDRHELLDGDDLTELPLIQNVQVAHPSGGGYFVHFPMKKGDPVTLWFTSRSIDVWKASDGSTPVDPGDMRMQDLSDAIAYPGARTFGAPLADVNASDLVIGKDGGDALVTLKDDGSILIGKGATKEVARKGDAVRVTIPSGTFLTAAQAGVLNPAPVEVDGEITEGSATIKASD